MRVSPYLLAGIVLMIMSSGARAIEPDHRRLNWFADSDGSIKPLKSAADWSKRRESILSAMQEVMGPLPDRTALPPLEIQTREAAARDGFRRETITIVGVYDEVITAYLYVPDDMPADQRRPAVIVLQSTGEVGKDIVDGVPERPNRAYAPELAARGFVVIAPDYPTFGEQRSWDLKTSKHDSGTMKAISDNMRCVDLLVARDDVDPKRIAAIGHSLGGHNALFTAAFDTRIGATVTSCGWTPFHHYYGGKKLVNWAQDRYMPRVRDVYGSDADRMPFDFAEVVGAIAPRAVFTSAPLHDSNFEVEGVRMASKEIMPLFDLLAAADRYVVRYPDCEHDFPVEIRQEAYRFIEANLKTFAALK